MRIDKWVEYTAMCDECNLRDRDISGGVYETKKMALEGAKEVGWVCAKGKTFCPDCWAELSKWNR